LVSPATPGSGSEESGSLVDDGVPVLVAEALPLVLTPPSTWSV
jgi:hypothetical protein